MIYMKKKSSTKSITNKNSNKNKNIINIHIGDKGKKKRKSHNKKSRGPSQGQSMTYIQPALSVTNKLPYDTTPYSAGYMPPSMQPVRATFASQEPIVNPTFATPEPLTSTPLVSEIKKQAEEAKIPTTTSLKAAAYKILANKNKAKPLKVAVSRKPKLRPIKVLQTIYNKKENTDYIPPATKTNNVVFVTDDIYTVKPDNFEDINPLQQNKLVTQRDIINEERRIKYANDPNKVKKLEVRREKYHEKKYFQNLTNKDSGDIGNPIYNSPQLKTSLKTASMSTSMHDMLNSPTTPTDNIFVKSTGGY